ncbi:MAG: threonine--tRNA ligase, partial [Candidatus Gribaldobacteria bacterium]|nr:threonine--tRNA ligase [Candidatus Gribaldobacteria bacterium]
MSQNIETIRHSLSHIMAMAVIKLYPKVKLGIGPAIENGFYYDFGDLKISDTDLPKIEQEMRAIIAQNLDFTKKETSQAEAEKLFANQPYKLELIKDLEKDGKGRPSLYQSGNFVDLCAGPHVKNTKEINPLSFKLSKLAGAYWRGD